MKSQYLELKAIADSVETLVNTAFLKEKQEAIEWITAQMVLFNLTIKDLGLDFEYVHGNAFKQKSKEQRQKMSATMKGRKVSEETKHVHRLESAKRQLPRRLGQPVNVYGINYKSMSAASLALKVSVVTISDRCKSTSITFRDWMYLPLNVEMLRQA